MKSTTFSRSAVTVRLAMTMSPLPEFKVESNSSRDNGTNCTEILSAIDGIFLFRLSLRSLP